MRILEIGCGAGKFKSNIVEFDEYWGIEPFEPVAKIAAENLDKVLVGTFKDVYDALPNNYFDCVVCADVIEHMDDEDWFLKNIKLKMKDKSIIVGSIPNVRHVGVLLKLLIWRDWEYSDIGILDRTHLRFFTKKSLKRAFISNEYAIEEFYGINQVKLKFDSIRVFFKSLGMIFFTYLLGSDTKFLQFGFRIRSR
jgi:2-polyprenyl-3-methyl-5-hydroxy-6-metoxy-1,4-benzoquinol methylase